jgi:hypothetical protein
MSQRIMELSTIYQEIHMQQVLAANPLACFIMDAGSYVKHDLLE